MTHEAAPAPDRVVADDLRFRMRLGIGERAYASLRAARTAGEVSAVGGGAAAGAAIAGSGAVASTFFTAGGFWAAVGFGATAVTPIGWIIAAGVLGGGSVYGVLRLTGLYAGSRVQTVPQFINSPIDVLGAGLVDQIGTLALKIAAIDGQIDPAEREEIASYFVRDWGIDPGYATYALGILEAQNGKQSLREAATALGAQLRKNPDCNARTIVEDVMALLAEVADADGRRDEREDMALERVRQALETEIGFSLARNVSAAGSAMREVARASSSGLGRLGTLAWNGFAQLGGKQGDDHPEE